MIPRTSQTHQRWLSLLPLGALAAFALWLSGPSAPAIPDALFVLAMGTALGVVLQRSRFCFFCMLRDYFEERDGRGLLGILAALAVGSLGYLVIFGAWLPDPSGRYLPAGAHIGPVSWVLAAGGLLFGWGMALSGSCISAHLYRLGEGSVLAPVALLGTVAGFGLGFLLWNRLYLLALHDAPTVWLPDHLGYGGSLGLQFLVLAGLFFLVRRRRSGPEATVEPRTSPAGDSLFHRVFLRRWSAWVGGIAVGWIGTMLYLRVEPLGVTAQVGSLARRATDAAGLLPERLNGLDGFPGCATAVGESLLRANGLLVVGLVGGAFVASLLAGQFQPERKHPLAFAAALLGGVLLGLGAMLSLGCTVGTLLSGISAFALSGWIFAASMTLGVATGLALRRRLFFWD